MWTYLSVLRGGLTQSLSETAVVVLTFVLSKWWSSEWFILIRMENMDEFLEKLGKTTAMLAR